MSRAADNKAKVKKFFEAMNSGDVDALVAAYAPEGELWTMGKTLISGRFSRAQIQASAAVIYDVFPEGLQFFVDGMIAEGNKVAVEAHSSGKHVSGQTYTNEYHFLVELDDSGRILAFKEYMDTERVTDILCGGQRPG